MAIRFEATGDFQQLLAENRKYQEAVVRLTEQVQRLESSAGRMGESSRRSFQGGGEAAAQYRATIRDLDSQLAAGKITQDQHAAAVRNAREALNAADGKVKEHKGALSGLGSQVTSLVAGYVSWQGALKLAGDALQFVQQETNKAKASQDSLVDQRRRLVQVAATDDGGKDLEAMIARADAAAAKFGVARNLAYEVLFSARSEGWDKDFEKVLATAPVMDPSAAAGVAGQVPKLFEGSQQISTEQAISGTLVAARESRLNFEQMARAMPAAAAGAAIAGASFSETAAALAVLAAKTKSGDEAATRIKGFATKLGLSAEYAGKGIIGGFEALAAADEESRREFLGSSIELNEAYLLLSESMPTIKAQKSRMDEELATVAAGGQSTLAGARQSALSDPAEQARLERVRAEIAREQANERQFARSGSLRQASVDREVSRMKGEDMGGLAQFAGQKAGQAADFVGLDADTTAGVTRGAGRVIGGSFGGMLGRRLLGAATFGLSDVYSFATGYREAQEPRPQPAPPTSRVNATSDPVLSDQLTELRAQRAAAERQTDILERVADQLARQPRSGASTAAAAPSVQRQGR